MERRTFIQTLIFSSGLILINPRNLSGTILDKDSFKIFMLYNNSGENPNLKSAWGLSIWIEGNDTATLFDTGGDSSILWDNILHSNLDIAKLSKIVISHNHWDHKNGLELILEKTFNKPEIYVVEKDYKEYVSKFQNAKIKSISNAEKIDTNIWSTGQLKAIYSGSELNEQSLILTQGNSIVLLTGCSHSGIVAMVKTIKEIFPEKNIELVAGGFHLTQKSNSEIKDISNNLKKSGVEKIAPSHCTGDNAITLFKEDWREKFIDLNLGNELTL